MYSTVKKPGLRSRRDPRLRAGVGPPFRLMVWPVNTLVVEVPQSLADALSAVVRATWWA
jgi:hypothetical protein